MDTFDFTCPFGKYDRSDNCSTRSIFLLSTGCNVAFQLLCYAHLMSMFSFLWWLNHFASSYCRWSPVSDRCVTLWRTIFLSQWRSEFWDTEVSTGKKKVYIYYFLINTEFHIPVHFSCLVQIGISKDKVNISVTIRDFMFRVHTCHLESCKCNDLWDPKLNFADFHHFHLVFGFWALTLSVLVP